MHSYWLVVASAVTSLYSMVEFFYCLIILNKPELQLVAGNLWAPIYEVKLMSAILRDRTSSAVCLCQQKRGVFVLGQNSMSWQ